ncbi:hypothetical protein SAMN06298224_0722 [Fibrobacter sp. UWB16]|uniref:hypothetical protein n=1 Tax=Fibrobacter sp. UWB16 TaxID=1945874 RepID=UPI000BDC0F07|nr:hypothetical protein [Fibrobacter sp. UWB16]SOD12510.1 hypothetical protein SAMN06298224_0722 [Fibrobacter sp. UWB16]
MRLLTFVIIASICFAHAYNGTCGTWNILKNRTKHKQKVYSLSNYNSERCSYEQYYDSVYTIKTPHIQVFYVLSGPHTTTKAFAETTAESMEAAWEFYVGKLQMRAPKGPSTTHHFQQEVKDGLYPIEIIDIEQVRDPYGEYSCASCYGLTIQQEENTATQIFMENDFYYGSSHGTNSEKIIADGDTCYYAKSTIPLLNKTHNYSYTDEWAKGIRLTSFHEFYHAVQLQYLNTVSSNNIFWFEASATGYEEVTNPEVDDYFSYLPSFFNDMGVPLSQINQINNHKIYGVSTFFLYLYNKVSKNIDKSIWENFSRNPDKPFETQLESSLQKIKLNADSIFHDYSVDLSFSGERSQFIPKKDWITSDQELWPSANVLSEDSITPEIESLAFKFYRSPNNYTEPNFTDYLGKASIISFSKGEATVHTIKSTKSLDSLVSILSTSDSTIWVFSRFGVSENIPITSKDASPHAFPVPWKQGPLCFAPLPRDKKFFEIRNRRGDLITQQKYDGTSFCMQEDQVKSMMAPGIYRFRVGNKGKTTSFMVIY